jgi:2,3-bisphosphoglycerate-dependent phosphoglycerate mutase
VLSDLYLIRHGEPLRNGALPYNMLPGPDLAPQGRDEAAQAATFLSDMGLEWLFASPFARTAQTAEVLVERLKLPLSFTPLIQEHGPSEQFAQVRARVNELLAALHDSPHRCVGLVAHGSPIRAALLELSREQLDFSRHVYPGGNPAPTCGIWHVRFEVQAQPRCELIFKPAASHEL